MRQRYAACLLCVCSCGEPCSRSQATDLAGFALHKNEQEKMVKMRAIVQIAVNGTIGSRVPGICTMALGSATLLPMASFIWTLRMHRRYLAVQRMVWMLMGLRCQVHILELVVTISLTRTRANSLKRVSIRQQAEASEAKLNRSIAMTATCISTSIQYHLTGLIPAEEPFYDALVDLEQEDEDPTRTAETAARLSAAAQDRLQVQMSEEQLAAVRAVLEQQMLANEHDSDGGEGSGSEEEASEEQAEEQSGEGQGGREAEAEAEADAEQAEWRWAGRSQRRVPLDQYQHPNQIPKFSSKTDWYKANSERLLYDGAALTIQQSVFQLMAWKADYAVTDAAFGAMLGMLSQLLLPKVRFLQVCPAAFTVLLPNRMYAAHPLVFGGQHFRIIPLQQRSLYLFACLTDLLMKFIGLV